MDGCYISGFYKTEYRSSPQRCFQEMSFNNSKNFFRKVRNQRISSIIIHNILTVLKTEKSKSIIKCENNAYKYQRVFILDNFVSPSQYYTMPEGYWLFQRKPKHKDIIYIWVGMQIWPVDDSLQVLFLHLAIHFLSAIWGGISVPLFWTKMAEKMFCFQKMFWCLC